MIKSGQIWEVVLKAQRVDQGSAPDIGDKIVIGLIHKTIWNGAIWNVHCSDGRQFHAMTEEIETYCQRIDHELSDAPD
jgi:hypothetical protein